MEVNETDPICNQVYASDCGASTCRTNKQNLKNKPKPNTMVKYTHFKYGIFLTWHQKQGFKADSIYS